ncbi:MAG: cytochrome P460 family protein [Acidobacteriota bacterium]
MNLRSARFLIACLVLLLAFFALEPRSALGPWSTAAATEPAERAAPPQPVELPADYRETFTNYLSLDRVQNPDQIIRLFANDIAMQGPDEDGLLPFGSILVAEVYKAKLDDSGEVLHSSLGRRIRDKMALIAVMERAEHLGLTLSEELRNEHWDFAAYKPDGSVAGKNLDTCRVCHAPLKNTHHLFSYEHLAQRLEPVVGLAPQPTEEQPTSTQDPRAASLPENPPVLDLSARDSLSFGPTELKVEGPPSRSSASVMRAGSSTASVPLGRASF